LDPAILLQCFLFFQRKEDGDLVVKKSNFSVDDESCELISKSGRQYVSSGVVRCLAADLVGAGVDSFSFWTSVIGSVLAGLGFHMGIVLGFSGLESRKVKLELPALVLCHFLMGSRVAEEWMDESERRELAQPSKSFLSLVVYLLATNLSVPPKREEVDSFISLLP
jgi:hypothetical protein